MQLNSESNAFSRTYGPPALAVPILLDARTDAYSSVGEIRRLDEMDRRLTYLTGKIEADEIPMRPFVETSYILEGRSAPQVIDELDPKLAEHEERVAQMQSGYETLGKRMAELEEARQVLRETASFFLNSRGRGGGRDDVVRGGSFDEPTAPLLENAMESGMALDAESGQIECASRTCCEDGIRTTC
jgi:V-type H+-transporting ATPase subunit a